MWGSPGLLVRPSPPSFVHITRRRSSSTWSQYGFPSTWDYTLPWTTSKRALDKLKFTLILAISSVLDILWLFFDPLTPLLNSAGVASPIFISDWFKFSRLILHIQLALTKFGIFADIDTIDVNLGEYFQPRTITHSLNCSISSYHCTSSNNC